ncbi:hypothetical protein OBA47_01495 [bacterium]|nr:hypothetical protein [bacterium]
MKSSLLYRSEGLDLLNRRWGLWKLFQPVVKYLPDQAALGAVKAMHALSILSTKSLGALKETSC